MPRPGLIVYACPMGALATQLDAYFAAARAACGPNTAHDYMPHVTLTGFFQDTAAALPLYRTALEVLLHAALPDKREPPLVISELHLAETFHALLVEGDWLKRLIAGFAARAASPTRDGPIRLKDWLHLSLAYDFPAAQHEHLAALANELVDPQASVGWELRLYESHGDGRWTCHGAWGL